MSREFWELVPVTEVAVGEHVKTYDGSDVIWTEKEVGKAVIWKDDCVFRRVPDADDPRVLRRALALLRTIRVEGYTPGGSGSIAIDARIKELESEGRSDHSECSRAT